MTLHFYPPGSLYGKLGEQARWAKSCVVIALSCPFTIIFSVPQENSYFNLFPYKASFIEPACSVKVAGYSPHSFLCLFLDLNSVLINKHPLKGLWAKIQLSWLCPLLIKFSYVISLSPLLSGHFSWSKGIYRRFDYFWIPPFLPLISHTNYWNFVSSLLSIEWKINSVI